MSDDQVEGTEREQDAARLQDATAGPQAAAEPPAQRDRRLLATAERLFQGGAVQDAVTGVKAIIGARFPDAEVAANTAMDKLRRGEVPTPLERAALMRMIKIMRPSLLTTAGVLADLPEYLSYAPGTRERWGVFADRVRPYAGSIARLEFAGGDSVGTGFLIAPDLLLTNRHVVAALSSGTGVLQVGQAVARLGYEHSSTAIELEDAVREVVACDEVFDLGLLRLHSDTAREPLPVAPTDAADGADIAVLGYPENDSKRNPLFVDVLFEGVFGFLRGAPGEVLKVSPEWIQHDCSTLGGNSGSPVLSIDTGRVVGVHRDGPMFLYRNEAVGRTALAGFLASHGVNS